jgi:hypothetical protein
MFSGGLPGVSVAVLGKQLLSSQSFEVFVINGTSHLIGLGRPSVCELLDIIVTSVLC